MPVMPSHCFVRGQEQWDHLVKRYNYQWRPNSGFFISNASGRLAYGDLAVRRRRLYSPGTGPEIQSRRTS